MAQKTIVQLIDDLDGTEISDGKGETVQFGLDGKSYAIDLTDKNAKVLREALAAYVAVASRIGSKTGARGVRTNLDGPKPADVRAWAKDNGHDLPERGRIPADVREAYDAAH